MKATFKWRQCGGILVLIGLMTGVMFAQTGGVNTTLIMAVGDSLTAGFQSGGLSITGQRNGYAVLVAKQMGGFLPLPTITAPGIPPVLTITSTGAIVPSSATPGTPLFPPVGNSFHFDVAVPGFRVTDILNQRPLLPDPVNRPNDILRDFILGVPGLAVPGAVNVGSEVDQVQALRPTFIILWIGANDVLGALTNNNVGLITPLASFTSDLQTAVQRLKSTGAQMVMANIPDVTATAFVVPVPAVAAQVGAPVAAVAAALGVTAGDSIFITGIPTVTAILTGQTAGPLPRRFVLTAADTLTYQTAIANMNSVIANTASAAGIPLVDIFTALNGLRANGVFVGGKKLTTFFLGGVFSLDGIHPTNTGYAIIANAFLQTINAAYLTSFPMVDVNAVFAADPLAPLVHKSGRSGGMDEGISLMDLMIDPNAFDGLLQVLTPSTVDTPPAATSDGSMDPGGSSGLPN
ncbi:MAG: SGNH/GDSL hydrolase family protein [Acidobacteriia bacterium]|nr:SGNH/GDSL hydrolase family protein [Terriglobia bacterium]